MMRAATGYCARATVKPNFGAMRRMEMSHPGPISSASTTYAYSPKGLLEQATVYADGAIARQAYDARGRLQSRTDEIGRVETYARDGLDRLTLTTFADSTEREVRYEDAQDIRREFDELDRVTTYQQDALGRTIKVTIRLRAISTKWATTRTGISFASASSTVPRSLTSTTTSIDASEPSNPWGESPSVIMTASAI